MNLRRGEPAALAVLLGGTGLLSLPVFQNLSRQYTDFGAHLEFAGVLLSTGSTSLPHFIFELGVVLLFGLGLTLSESAVLIAVGAVMATGIVVFCALRNYATPWVAGLLSAALLLVGSLSVLTLPLTWPDWSLYLGYIPSNVYHNPTLVLLKPTALGLVLVGARAFDENVTTPRWNLVAIAGLLSVLSCLTKPSFQICFLPGLGLLVALAIVQRREVDLRLCVLGIALPSFAALAWQYFVSFSGAQSAQILFAPFAVMEFLADGIGLKFVLSMVFPVSVTAFFFREALGDRLMSISWSTALFGLAYTYFLAESGARFNHGNFLWSSYVAVFILYVSSVALLLRQKKGYPRLLCWGILGLHVVSGTVFAVTQSMGDAYLKYW